MGYGVTISCAAPFGVYVICIGEEGEFYEETFSKVGKKVCTLSSKQ